MREASSEMLFLRRVTPMTIRRCRLGIYLKKSSGLFSGATQRNVKQVGLSS